MNEYTRREEVRWTFISSMLLVLCIAPAVLLLVTAQGRLIPDQAAKTAAAIAAERATQAHTCVDYGTHLEEEVEGLKRAAKPAHLVDEPDAGAPKKPPPRRFPLPQKEKEPDHSMAWQVAQPTQQSAKLVASCRVATEGITGVLPETAPAWDAIVATAAIAPPDKTAQFDAARQVLKLMADAKLADVNQQLKKAEATVKEAADQAQATADKAYIREPIPEGIVPRRIAVGVGVGLSVIALILGYMSVRAASRRRLLVLVPLREAARAGQPGVHAAAILRLAAGHNGGEPGLVIGGALGGLVSAALLPADTDIFIAGVMAGLLIGLGMQWAFRLALGASRWRLRAAELADIEKPAIPIVLVLSGVNIGLEAPFIAFFNGLSVEDAAMTVEKLAAQAEEKILAAADARH